MLKTVGIVAGSCNGMVLPEYEEPLPSLAVGTVFIKNTVLVPSLPTNTLMAIYGGFPAFYGYVTNPIRKFSVSVQTSEGDKTWQELI